MAVPATDVDGGCVDDVADGSVDDVDANESWSRIWWLAYPLYILLP
jgi:hypothetical protein